MAGNTHYALLVFGGDYDGDHPDLDLRGAGPAVTLLAAGPEDFCWESAAEHARRHPLRRDEAVEVVARHPSTVRDPGWSEVRGA